MNLFPCKDIVECLQHHQAQASFVGISSFFVHYREELYTAVFLRSVIQFMKLVHSFFDKQNLVWNQIRVSAGYLTCVKLRMTPLDLWKRTFSTFIIALSTASSSAAFTDNRKTCTEKLGVSSRLANFGVPFGQLLYNPGASVLFWFAAVSVAESRNVEVSLVWYVTAIVISIILSAASPPEQ